MYLSLSEKWFILPIFNFFLPLYSKVEYFSENFDLQNSKIKLFIAITILHLLNNKIFFFKLYVIHLYY